MKSQRTTKRSSVSTINSISLNNLHNTTDSKEVLSRHIPPPTTTKNAHGPQVDHPTTYIETFIHLMRANIGSGFFAMGDAFRNGGLILGAVLTLFFAVVCVYNQHVLLHCSRRVKLKKNLPVDPDYAETVELCFEYGSPRLRRLSKLFPFLANLFICATQLGFCCVYVVFSSSTVIQVLSYYGINLHPSLPLVIVLFPILIPSLIMNLKYLALFSGIANICMSIGIIVVFYYAFTDVPSIAERRFVGEWSGLPLYFGTAMFAFEGIALVLPLKNAMKNPDSFDVHRLGVLNVGMTIATALYISFGFFGYWRWGEDVAGSLTLNLPENEIVAQIVKTAVGFAMCLTFSLQFYVPLHIMLHPVQNVFKNFCNPTIIELLFRTFMVAAVFAVAILVPYLSIIISLVGALCASSIALFFPVLCELVIGYGDGEQRPSTFVWCKNGSIILLAVFGMVIGTFTSISELIKASGGNNS